MALVRAVGRGGRAVRVGGHGFLSDTRGRPLSCLRPLSTARPLGWDRASRAVGCAGPSTALDQLSAAADNQVPRTRRMLVSLFSELEQCTRTIHSRAALRTPPIRAETQDWENSIFFRVLRGRATLTSNQTDFNCGRCLSRRFAQKADAALVQGATGGQHSRRLAKRCPHRQPTTRIHSPAASLSARATPAVPRAQRIHHERALTPPPLLLRRHIR